jgi:hypothetical protein
MRTLLLAMTTAWLASSCGDSGRFFIVQDQVPARGCVVTTERTVYQGEGLLDLALVGGDDAFAYQLFPLIQNDYPSAGGNNSTEPNRLFIRAFRVRLEAGDGAPAAVSTFIDQTGAAPLTQPMVEFQEPWAGTIEPGGGLLAAAVGVIPSGLARAIRSKQLTANGPINLKARVRAVGQRRDGDVESSEFVFPIKVCEGCLIANLRECPYTATNLGNACNIAQDAVVDCCQAGASLTCPAVGK